MSDQIYMSALPRGKSYWYTEEQLFRMGRQIGRTLTNTALALQFIEQVGKQPVPMSSLRMLGDDVLIWHESMVRLYVPKGFKIETSWLGFD